MTDIQTKHSISPTSQVEVRDPAPALPPTPSDLSDLDFPDFCGSTVLADLKRCGNGPSQTDSTPLNAELKALQAEVNALYSKIVTPHLVRQQELEESIPNAV